MLPLKQPNSLWRRTLKKTLGLNPTQPLLFSDKDVEGLKVSVAGAVMTARVAWPEMALSACHLASHSVLLTISQDKTQPMRKQRARSHMQLFWCEHSAGSTSQHGYPRCGPLVPMPGPSTWGTCAGAGGIKGKKRAKAAPRLEGHRLVTHRKPQSASPLQNVCNYDHPSRSKVWAPCSLLKENQHFPPPLTKVTHPHYRNLGK